MQMIAPFLSCYHKKIGGKKDFLPVFVFLEIAKEEAEAMQLIEMQ